MATVLTEQELEVPTQPTTHGNLLGHISQAIETGLGPDEQAIRCAITESKGSAYRCEIGKMVGSNREPQTSALLFKLRRTESTESFNAVLVVPTGIGAEIGGHAGDATPVAALLALACDTLITHPNVVNASDIIQVPPNTLYVEGGVLTRLLMGTIGLQKVRNNRLLVVIDAHWDTLFTNAAVNAVNAARTSYGLICPRIVELDSLLEMRSLYSASGRAAGQILGVDALFEVLDECRPEYDAVAISSVISVPPSYHRDYFEGQGDMVNPWGGVEAMLTHAISSLYDVPSAHSPMFESQDIANMDPGVGDPRMAAEAVSMTFLQCILRGLQRSPRIVTDIEAMWHQGVLTASDVSCLIIPDGCIGLPTLAALEQGISVIAVRENRNLMDNDLTALPWSQGQLHVVENYWEAVGVMTALKAGIEPTVVRRPIHPVPVQRKATSINLTVEQLVAKSLPF